MLRTCLWFPLISKEEGGENNLNAKTKYYRRT